MNTQSPLRTAIAGIGGFGNAHHGIFLKLEQRGEVRVTATCDPALPNLAGVCEAHQFAERGVSVFDSFEKMAAHGEFDLGVIAAPIQFHAPMHAAFVRLGAACYLEKPPTLDPQELELMILTEQDARIETNVGFSFIHLQDRLALKQRMIAGEFGILRQMSFLGLAPRSPAYFGRNRWAGRMLIGDTVLLDSCAGNALSHYLNAMLLFAGKSGLQEWARPIEIQAELYRANPIEGPDTVFASCLLEGGIEFRMALSHACSNAEQITEETLIFEKATITIRSSNQLEIQRADGEHASFSMAGPSLADSVDNYLGYVRGNSIRPAQRLADCRGFVELNALLYLAAGRIHTVPDAYVLEVPTESSTQASTRAISDIEEASRRLVTDGLLPSDTSLAWARPGGKCGVSDLPNLRTVIQTIRDSRQ